MLSRSSKAIRDRDDRRKEKSERAKERGELIVDSFEESKVREKFHFTWLWVGRMGLLLSLFKFPCDITSPLL